MKHSMKRTLSKAMAFVLCFSMISSIVFAGDWDLANGDISIKTSDTGSQLVSQGVNVDVQEEHTTITGTGSDGTKVTISGDGIANVTIKDVTLNNSNDSCIDITDKAAVGLTVSGTNNLTTTDNDKAAIHNGSGNLTIATEKNSELNATSGNTHLSGGAAIGSNRQEKMSGTICITGEGNVNAENKKGSAAIGSGALSDMSGAIIIVDADHVKATTGTTGAAIGSGARGDVTETGSIYIADSNVEAKAGKDAAAIGAGSMGVKNSGKGNMNGIIDLDKGADVTLTGTPNKLGAGKGGTMEGENGFVIIHEDAVINGDKISKDVLDEPGMVSDPNRAFLYKYADIPAAPAAPRSLRQYYWVLADGQGVDVKSSLQNGVLTVSCDLENADFHTSVFGVQYMMNHDIKTLVYKTASAETSLDLKALAADQAMGADIVLTHDGAKTALTVGGNDMAALLK